MADTNLLKAVAHVNINEQLNNILDKILEKITIINTTDCELDEIPEIFIKQLRTVRRGSLPIYKLYIIFLWLETGFDPDCFHWCLYPLNEKTQAEFLVYLRKAQTQLATGLTLSGDMYTSDDTESFDTHFGYIVQDLIHELQRK